MGLISETRTSLENPQTPLSFPAEWLLDIFNGGRTDSGMRVSEMTALQVTTVYACVEIKAGAVASLDLKIFEKMVNPDGRLQRRIAHEHDYWDLLESEPNPEMTAFTLKKTVQAHRMLWSNGYIEIQRDNANRAVALWPRNPSRIRPRRATKKFTINGDLVRPGDMYFSTTEGMDTVDPNPEQPLTDGYASERPILAADILHIPGLSLDGRIGQGAVNMARNAIGLALATEKFGGKFFANGAVGYGVIKYPGTMSPEDHAAFVRELQEAWGGENVNRPVVLEAGLDYTQTSTKPNESQFLETRNFQVCEVGRVFGVAPHMLGVTEKTARGNTEQIGQEFLIFSLRPDLEAWRQETKRKLFPAPSLGRNAGRRFGVFFDTRPLTMPAANDLRTFIQAMIQWGVMTPNDAREWLDMNPISDDAADATWMQINMAPSDQLFATPALPSIGPAGESDDDEQDPKDKKNPAGRSETLVTRLARSYSRIFRDAFGRICARHNVDNAAFKRAFMPVLASMGEDVEQLAAQQFNAAPNPEGLESSTFLAEYLESMRDRSRKEQWNSANGHTGQICDRELKRAIRALTIEVYRQAATRAAKEETEVTQC